MVPRLQLQMAACYSGSKVADSTGTTSTDTITTIENEAKFIDDIYEIAVKITGYVVTKCTFEEQLCLLISHEMLYNHPPFGMASRCRISVKEYEYIVHVLMREVERGSLEQSASEKVLNLCSKYSTNSISFKFCPGLDVSEYESKREVIHYDVKSVCKTSEPFLRVESSRCLRWHELAKNTSLERRRTDAVVCPPCVRLRCEIDHRLRLVEAESPSKKIARQSSCLYVSVKSSAAQDQPKKRKRGYETQDRPRGT